MKTLLVIVGLIVICTFIIPFSSATLVVDDDRGNWVDFNSISEAIAESQPGSEIRVYSGNYPEQLSIEHPITIIGNGSLTRIDFSNHQAGIILNDSEISLDSLSIESDSGGTGIIINGNQNSIMNCWISMLHGIGINVNLSNQVTLHSIDIERADVGIRCRNSHDVSMVNISVWNFIMGLSIENSTKVILEDSDVICPDGIGMKMVKTSNILISGNNVSSFSTAVALSDSTNLTFTENEVISQWKQFLIDSCGNTTINDVDSISKLDVQDSNLNIIFKVRIQIVDNNGASLDKCEYNILIDNVTKYATPLYGGDDPLTDHSGELNFTFPGAQYRNGKLTIHKLSIFAMKNKMQGNTETDIDSNLDIEVTISEENQSESNLSLVKNIGISVVIIIAIAVPLITWKLVK